MGGEWELGRGVARIAALGRIRLLLATAAALDGGRGLRSGWAQPPRPNPVSWLCQVWAARVVESSPGQHGACPEPRSRPVQS